MIKHLLSIFILSSIVFAGCTGKAEVNPDNASAITGTYKMTVYNTDAANNSNPAPGNNVILTKIDKNNVKGQIVYSNGSPSVDVNNLEITKNGSVYNLYKSYSNATASGSVSGNKLQLNINYSDGSYAHITAVK